MKRLFPLPALGLLACLAVYGIHGAHAVEPQSSSTPSNASSATAKGTPKIQFETNFFDFGKTVSSEKLSGVFKFKNVGNGVLKVDPPVPSCDCTESRVKPETLAPGETGEILYTIKLDRMVKGQRFIKVSSNDPQNPTVQLTMQLDHSPLYEISPKVLRINLAAGKDQGQGNFIVSRTDGKPLEIDRLTTSQKWMSAQFDSSAKTNESSARINVTIHRPSVPTAVLAGSVQIWRSNQTASPVQTLFVTGELQGDVTAVPSKIYWVIPDFGKDKTKYPTESLTRTIELISATTNKVEFKNARSSIHGMSVQIVPKETGKTTELVLKFDDVPQAFANGKVSVETSLPSMPAMEVPVTVAVPGAQ